MKQAAATLLGCLSFIPAANAQTSTRTIEVASVHLAAFSDDNYLRGWAMVTGPCNIATRGKPSISGNIVTLTRYSFCQLIAMAYDAQDFRITGVPEPMLKAERTNYFDVRLKAEGDGALTENDARDLLKHCSPIAFNSKLNETPAETRPERNGVPMATYVEMISKYVDRPVVDRTGLTDAHYVFQWNSTELNRDLKEGLPVPSIFREVEEQLGLNLKPATAPFDVLVIDHAEPPSQN